ncbi:hypothetical protein BASA61_001584, partial [Batrachochytrium salamandrivorans]
FADSEHHCGCVDLLIEQWANQWEKQFGVAKCVIISFMAIYTRIDNPIGIRTPLTVGQSQYGSTGLGNKSHLATTANDNHKGIRLFTGARPLHCPHGTPSGIETRRIGSLTSLTSYCHQTEGTHCWQRS